jgi:hypothetical protein
MRTIKKIAPLSTSVEPPATVETSMYAAAAAAAAWDKGCKLWKEFIASQGNNLAKLATRVSKKHIDSEY